MEKDLSFEKFLHLENCWQGKPDDASVRLAYAKVSSYLLQKEGINIAKVRDPQLIGSLAAKLASSAEFMPDDSALRQQCLQVLARFSDYINYIKS